MLFLFDRVDQSSEVDLADIHALQLIRRRAYNEEYNYWCYELNLVFGDGQRGNIVNHGNIKELRRDAERLARFLNVKFWDASADG